MNLFVNVRLHYLRYHSMPLVLNFLFFDLLHLCIQIKLYHLKLRLKFIPIQWHPGQSLHGIGWDYPRVCLSWVLSRVVLVVNRTLLVVSWRCTDCRGHLIILRAWTKTWLIPVPLTAVPQALIHLLPERIIDHALFSIDKCTSSVVQLGFFNLRVNFNIIKVIYGIRILITTTV